MPSTVICPECHSPIIFGARGKTVTRSFRIDEAVMAALEEESAKRSISVNTLVNQQLLPFANFDRFHSRLDLVKLTGSSLQKLLESAPDDKIAEAAVLAALDTPRSIILSKYGQVTFETTVEYIQMLAQFANLYECTISESPEGKVITLFHRFGTKGSLFLAKFVGVLLEQMGYASKIETSAHSVGFVLQKRKDATYSRR
ncbi:MAG: hypothetical protein ABSG45_03240 [Nitrososphaerales archaeon]|jgi:hypothetical protein